MTLKYVTENSGIETGFSIKANRVDFLNDIRTNEITIEEAKASQDDFDKYLDMKRKKTKK